jgi:hypothetical protein
MTSGRRRRGLNAKMLWALAILAPGLAVGAAAAVERRVADGPRQVFSRLLVFVFAPDAARLEAQLRNNPAVSWEIRGDVVAIRLEAENDLVRLLPGVGATAAHGLRVPFDTSLEKRHDISALKKEAASRGFDGILMTSIEVVPLSDWPVVATGSPGAPGGDLRDFALLKTRTVLVSLKDDRDVWSANVETSCSLPRPYEALPLAMKKLYRLLKSEGLAN